MKKLEADYSARFILHKNYFVGGLFGHCFLGRIVEPYGKSPPYCVVNYLDFVQMVRLHSTSVTHEVTRRFFTD